MHVCVVLRYIEARARGVSVRPCCWDTVPHWESGFQCLFLSCFRLGFCCWALVSHRHSLFLAHIKASPRDFTHVFVSLCRFHLFTSLLSRSAQVGRHCFELTGCQRRHSVFLINKLLFTTPTFDPCLYFNLVQN